MYNFVPLNGGRAEYKFASKDDGRNVFEQGKRRVMLATLLGPPAAIEDTGRPACTERAVRHAVENDRRELSDERKAHYPTDRRRTSSTVDEQTDRLAARPTASSVAASKRRAVRHARDGPSGMQSKAMFESLRIVCKLNIQRVIDGRARQLAKERTGGSAACTTAGGIAACERRAVRHARNGPSGMQAEANAEIRCASSIFYRLARRAQHLTS